jgi:nicotinamide-nucleotide amidase
MKAFIVTIGDEILIGQTLNTNAAYIGEKLTNSNVSVVGSSVVPDDKELVVSEFERVSKLCDIVIVTGGLGPTHDDITRDSIVSFFETELVVDNEVLSDIKKFFEIRKRELTKTNEDQALIPKIAVAIRNPRGTAPGFWIENKSKIFVAMPGVPYEMKGMIEEFVMPRINEIIGSKNRILLIKNLLTTGIPESMLYDRLGNVQELLSGAKLAFLPSQFGVKMRITVENKTSEDAQNRLDEIEQKIRTLVGRFIFGKNNESLEEVVAKLLIDRGLKLSTAESCTGGLIANRLTNINGSSRYFERGIVAYTNAAKVELLHVDEDSIATNGAVSMEVARQMAEGIKSVSGSDIGLAVTGIMGPTGGSAAKPVGTVFIGICDDKICTAKEFHFGDDRLLNKDRTSQAALEMLRRNLLNISYDD